MKKIISLSICLLMLFALSVPAFAAEEFTELIPTDAGGGYMELHADGGGNYIVRENCEVNKIISFGNGTTLTIADGVTVVVKDNYSCGQGGTINVDDGATLIFNNNNSFNLSGTLNVYGTVDITADKFDNATGTMNVYGTVDITADRFINSMGTMSVSGTIDISKCRDRINHGGTINMSCGGRIIGIEGIENKRGGTVNRSEHSWANSGVCSVCNTPCEHKWDAATGKCTVCGMEIENAPAETVSGDTASALSEGSLTIIVGVVCLAVGFLAAMFIFKKKKTEDVIHNS